jgi:hypothetical protein
MPFWPTLSSPALDGEGGRDREGNFLFFKETPR